MSRTVRWPLMINRIRRGRISNTYGMVRKWPNGNPKPHQGWDLQAVVGVHAMAIADGEIVFVRHQGDYGLQVCMRFTFNGKTRYAFYAHLSQRLVSAGDAVQIGDPIARCGKSGNASGLPAREDHLHFEIRTIQNPGGGLGGRVSPLTVYKTCPLGSSIIDLR